LKTLGQQTVYPLKQIYFTLFAFLMASSLMANTKFARANNLWDNNSTWNPSSAPIDGDTLIIPSGKTVTVNGNFDLYNVVIIISGVLDLDNGKLRLNSASKVYVQSGGKLTGNGSNDQLTINGDLKYRGSDGILSGPQYADNGTSDFDPWVILTVSFQSFYVTRQGTNNQLSWSTSAEVNHAYYAIEKSTDSRTWKQIAQVTGTGTSDLVNKYGYTDKNSSDAVVYYRIREVSTNGANFYSAIRALHNGNSSLTHIYASTNKTITIDLNSDVKDNVSIQLINMSGQVIVRKDFKQASYRLIVDAMSAGSGVYAVQVSDSKGWSEVKKIAL
jgi:hypothetical protein